MSANPHDIPQDVWDESGMKFDQLYDAEPDLEGSCEFGIRYMACKMVMAERAKAPPMTPDIREKAERLADHINSKYRMQAYPEIVQLIAADISQALLEAHNAGRAEMKEEALKAELEAVRAHLGNNLDQAVSDLHRKIATAIHSIT